jgi:FkbM family methyltransferase
MRWLDRLRRPLPSGNQATESDIYNAYRLILRRAPDPSGLEHFRRRVRAGLPLPEMINDFLRSDEFHDRMEADRLSELRRVDLGGYELLVPSADPDFGAIINSYRTYEEPVRQALRAHLRAGDVCLDVGANIGVMSFLAASIVGASGLVVAVEPNPENVQVLCRTIRMTGAANVMVLPIAASDARRVFSLTGRSNTRLMPPREPVTGGGHFVQALPLDDLLGGLPRLDFVKLDIEGHEPPALRGLARLLSRHRPGLLVEFNPACLAVQHQDPLDCLRLVFEVHPQVRALSSCGDDETFTRPEDVLSFWTRRSADLASNGALTGGSLHFDLVAARW